MHYLCIKYKWGVINYVESKKGYSKRKFHSER